MEERADKNMIRAPFTSTRFEEERAKDTGKIFTIRLNKEELENLRFSQNILQQEKQSTAIKQLAMFGIYVLQERSNRYLLEVLNNNIRKNKRIGIDRVDIQINEKVHL